ncbi:hypothetical protein [Actinoplanes sp. NBRC 103695]|uniref:hypothetical protein n=1 Tax=Actinoplanes sp. NBRC 103695 TaxID=3032202 RepID=UPI0024A301A1|nr:hypothetical protein [Actinoplanes sp. NBRC 103695]GLZ00654.1 hypothetical protein Acsp02_79060 [Actinoplanes sp. NBRC 103695]
MTTLQLERPGFTRVAQLRHTSPGRLQLMLAVLVALGLLTGLLAGVAASSAGSGTDDLGGRAQPLLTEAETIYSALADADTTAAQAFLGGGLEPATLTVRYENDLTRVTTALTSAARRTPEGGESADAVRELSTGVTRYAALVAAARANNRQGLPVGSAYLSQASALNREILQPQADRLLRIAQQEVDDAYSSARSTPWIAIYVILMILLFVMLAQAQVRLSRTTKRTFNIPLVAATGLTLVLALVSFGVLVAQRTHLDTAEEDGSTPVTLLSKARIFALRERGDEALALAARGNGEAYEQDFGTVSQRLTGQYGLLEVARASIDGDAEGHVREAMDAHVKYLDIHRAITGLDEQGDHDGAATLAVGPEATTTFDKITDGIGAALDDRMALFTKEIDAAGRGLGALTVLGPLLALMICALCWLGIRARLEEYR